MSDSLQISMVSNAKGIKTESVSLFKVLEDIAKCRWQSEQDAIRKKWEAKFQETGGDINAAKKAVKRAKESLPAAMFAGTFSYRANDGWLSPSGCLPIDIDRLFSDLPAVRENLRTSPHVLFDCESVTGTGLRGLLKIAIGTKPDEGIYRACFEAVDQHVFTVCGVRIDPACKDPARLSFVSADRNARLNLEARPILPLPESERPKAKPQPDAGPPRPGKPSKDEVREMLQFVPKRPDYPDWLKIVAAVGDALDDTDAIEVLNEWSPEECAGEYAEKLRHRLRDVHIGTLIHLAKENGWTGIRLIEFKSPLELKNFVPPPGAVLVGDYHITLGSVFVEAGPPGVGKSLGLTALGIAGATGSPWFGYTVHRRFKTMIIQTENGLFRLCREFSDLDCEAIEKYVRVCPPPPFGLCFKRKDFCKQLADAIAEFQPDIVGFDPWNAVAREQTGDVYLDAFDALKSVLPTGDKAPALGIVAHTRKPKSDEKCSGRALLNLLAGSYVLGSVPRAVFIMQAASDDVTDDRVVWTCCKNNDGELGHRTAWKRQHGLFLPVEFFDWQSFDHPPKEGRGLQPEIFRELLQRGSKYDKSQLVSIIIEDTGCRKTAAYSLVKRAVKKAILHLNKKDKNYELL
jgi:VirE-like protein/AAA domain-containing protein